MSLDVVVFDLETRELFYDGNITHNVASMADKAGIYLCMWHPERCRPKITRAKQLIPRLKRGLAYLRRPRNEAKLRALEPENGWGSLDGLIRFTQAYLAACVDHPEAAIYASA